MSGRFKLCVIVWALVVVVATSESPVAAIAASGTRELYIIAHAGLHVSAADVADIYLGEKELATGVQLEPMDNAEAQLDFLATVLKLDVKRYNALWTKKSFRDALNPPLVRGSDVEVVAAVRSTPGGIGYVSTPPTGVAIIAKYSL
jgi:hypothetical protein